MFLEVSNYLAISILIAFNFLGFALFGCKSGDKLKDGNDPKVRKVRRSQVSTKNKRTKKGSEKRKDKGNKDKKEVPGEGAKDEKKQGDNEKKEKEDGDKKDEPRKEESKKEEKKEENKEEKKENDQVNNDDVKQGSDVCEVKPDKDKLIFEKGLGKLVFQLENKTDVKRAIKIKCSDNNIYKLNPVYSYIEPGKAINVEVIRFDSPEKNDKLLILNTQAVLEKGEPQDEFNKNENYPSCAIQLSVAA
uniref:Major sperm protein n=1 Tax=Strongyloides stercoralis TaxID=6248 RepID=A0A0K0EN02_STRER